MPLCARGKHDGQVESATAFTATPPLYACRRVVRQTGTSPVPSPARCATSWARRASALGGVEKYGYHGCTVLHAQLSSRGQDLFSRLSLHRARAEAEDESAKRGRNAKRMQRRNGAENDDQKGVMLVDGAK